MAELNATDHERRSRAIRCIHASQFPCAQCLANMSWNFAATGKAPDPALYLDAETTALALFTLVMRPTTKIVDERLTPNQR